MAHSMKRNTETYATLQRQASILDALMTAFDGFSVRELARELGVSRQLTLYHLKKMAAKGMIVMQLEPMARNGQVQFRVWLESTLILHYQRKVRLHAVRVAA